MDPIDGIEKAAEISGNLASQGFLAFVIFLCVLLLLALVIILKLYLNSVEKRSQDYTKLYDEIKGILKDSTTTNVEVKSAIKELTTAVNIFNQKNNG